MKIETNGWGDSAVATRYVYEWIYDLLDAKLSEKEMQWDLSRLMDQLAHNYKVDTGKLIGEQS